MRYDDCTRNRDPEKEKAYAWDEKMKVPHVNKYSAAAVLFMIAAAVFVAISLTSRLGEFITAAFVISGMVCVMMGIFMLTFSRGEPIDPEFVGLLPAEGCMNLCRISSDLGINGPAHFLPSAVTGETRVMQFNPSLPYDGSGISAKKSFPESGLKGLVTVPSCDPLILVLQKRNKLTIPDNEENLSQLLREATGEIFELASRVSTHWHSNTFTITFHRYRFIAGCKLISRQAPGCCSRHPCPACSLCGVLVAAGTGKVVTVEQCTVSTSGHDINLVLQILPSPDLHP